MRSVTQTPESSRAATETEQVELTVVMPCLNEAETLSPCITKAQQALKNLNITGEVVVADNGSTDGSQQLARSLGARVVDVPEKGYGAALIGGIRAARGRYVVMGDSDDSYDFSNLGPFLSKLREGFDLVMGNRFVGGIKPGAMPPLHRYFGNPVLSGIGRLFFTDKVGDFHCGLRGFNRQSILGLDLRTTGMEFASEMVVKASIQGLRIAEVPTTLSPDGRSRPPHLRSWRDGWRHLRFLLMFSPRFLFLFPGFLIAATGALVVVWLLPGPRQVGRVVFDVHTMLFATAAVFLGVQSILFWTFTKVFAISEGFLMPDPRLDKLFKYVTLETGLVASGLLFVTGLVSAVYALTEWGRQAFGPLNPTQTLRVVIPSVLLMVVGVQGMFASFFLSILGLRRR